MNFIEHLRIRTPLVWLRTTEPDRYTGIIARNSSQEVYRLDPFNGLVVWRKQKWLKVLVDKLNPETGEVEQVPCFDQGEALRHVIEQRGTYIQYFADKVMDDMLPLMAGILTLYREAFWVNDLNEIPTQFILISPNSDVPPELVNSVAYVDAPFPSEEELAEIATHIVEEGKLDADKVDFKKLIRGGLGLTESEFVQACMLSLKLHKTIDAQYVQKFKLDKIKSSGVLEIRQPTLSLDDIGGLDVIKKLIEHVVWAWNNEEEAAKLGVKPLRRLLFVGVPGTGKSAICEATASSLELELAKTGISQAMNKFIGQSESNMRAVFQQIHAMAPLVVWMDELGRDLSSGDWEGDGGTTSRVHGEFLTGLQELPNNVFLMAAANRIDRVAPEMLRADRFDKVFFVGFPTGLEREDIFKIHLTAANVEGTFDLQQLAGATGMFTGAEIKALIADTIFSKSLEGIHTPITTDDLVQAAPRMLNRVWLKHPDSIVTMYQRALEEWDWASSQQKLEAIDVVGGHTPRTAATTKVRGKTMTQAF